MTDSRNPDDTGKIDAGPESDPARGTEAGAESGPTSGSKGPASLLLRFVTTPLGWLFGQAYLLLALTMLMWGGNAVASRLAVGEISPMALTCLRWTVVIVIAVAIAHKELVRDWPLLREKLPMIIGMGALGFTGFNALFYVGAHYTTAVNLTIIQGAMPIIVLIGALLVYGTRITPLQVAGTIVTLTGVALVATRGELATLLQFAFNPGDLLMLSACVLYAGYTLGLRNRPQVSGLAFFAILAIIAFITAVPLLGIEIAMGQVQWPTLNGWLIILYVSLFPSLIAQLCFMRAVELIGPGRSGLFVNLVPIFGAGLAVMILAEPFHLYHAAALAFVLGGIALAERKRGE